MSSYWDWQRKLHLTNPSFTRSGIYTMNTPLKKALLAGLIFCFTCLGGCQTKLGNNDQPQANSPEYLHRSVKKLTDVIIHDIFSPPVAARIYAYTSVAAYEALVPAYPNRRSLINQLNGLTAVAVPDGDKTYHFPLASACAYLTVAKKLIFSEDRLVSFETELYKEFEKSGLSSEVVQNSLAYGQKVAQHVIDWSAKDNYKQSRSFPKYTLTNEKSKWQPTPPGYMEAIEPNWSKIRSFVLDSASVFAPPPPAAYSVSPQSEFYKLAQEVYKAGSKLTKEHEEIARFWDCNPFAVNLQGHVMFATKKITPGGHWMGIACIASKQSRADLMRATEAYLYTSLAIFDGFISCWDEKYRSQLVRPESYINEVIDPQWVPFLQTPPFPEYTSGHSVISAAAATVLAELYGDQLAYQDTTEVRFGLPPRNFSSFEQAANEASISRLYGGIHYMPAIMEGQVQGRKVGELVKARVQTRRPSPAVVQ